VDLLLSPTARRSAGQNFYPTNGTLVFTNGTHQPVVQCRDHRQQPGAAEFVRLAACWQSDQRPGGGPRRRDLDDLETGGSYVIPAGAMVVTNYTSHLNDGIIGSNDTVQVLFAFRDSAGLNVTNLIAYLLATNGVLSPSPASQTYGPLTVYGHSVSKPSPSPRRAPTRCHRADLPALRQRQVHRPATFVFTLGTWTTTFANTNMIIINDNAAASPYPSIINVSGVGQHAGQGHGDADQPDAHLPSDIDALVVSPTTNTLIMAHTGGAATSSITSR
jgi:hypothetical protein